MRFRIDGDATLLSIFVSRYFGTGSCTSFPKVEKIPEERRNFKDQTLHDVIARVCR
jgi:hypothetical protein